MKNIVEVNLRLSSKPVNDAEIGSFILYKPMKRWVEVMKDCVYSYRVKFDGGTVVTKKKNLFVMLDLRCGTNPFTGEMEKFSLPVNIEELTLSELNELNLCWEHKKFSISAEMRSISLASCVN